MFHCLVFGKISTWISWLRDPAKYQKTGCFLEIYNASFGSWALNVLRVIYLINLTGQKRYVTELKCIWPVTVSGDSPDIILGYLLKGQGIGPFLRQDNISFVSEPPSPEYRKWKPIDARWFGYVISTRPPARPPVQTSREVLKRPCREFIA